MTVKEMDEYIEREALMKNFCGYDLTKCVKYGNKDANQQHDSYSTMMMYEIASEIEDAPAADVAPVRHGRWILEAHDERVNYRWNVTAECSECCDEQKEIWAGFFPNVPPSIARDVALVSAESVKLSNYCPNCGAKMDLEDIP